MKRTLLTAAICLLGVQVAAAPAPKLTWEYEGYSKLPLAAAEAKRTQRRMLVGLSGSPG